MRLDILDKETKFDGNLGYKVFEVLPDGNFAHIGFPDMKKRIGKEYRDTNFMMIGDKKHQYRTGYHIFPSKIDAEAYLQFVKRELPATPMTICRVHFNRVTTLGAVCFDDKPHVVVVTGAMTIIDTVKDSGFKPMGWGRMWNPKEAKNLKK